MLFVTRRLLAGPHSDGGVHRTSLIPCRIPVSPGVSGQGNIMSRTKAIIGLLVLAVASYSIMATLALSAPAEIEEKRAEAERVLIEIQDLDGRLGLAIENYNGATLKLGNIEGKIDSTSELLDLARKKYGRQPADCGNML